MTGKGSLNHNSRKFHAKNTDPNRTHWNVEYCNENYRHSIQLDDLEKALNINKYYISHLFRQKVGIGFSDFINYLRISDACAMLIDSDIPITEIGFAVGFGSTRSFNRCFVSVIGESPRNYRSHYWRGKKDLAVT